MSVINSRECERLGGKSAREVFIGLKGTDPLDVLYDPEFGMLDVPLDNQEIARRCDLLVEYFVESAASVREHYEKARTRRNELYRRYFLTGSRRKKYDADPRRGEEWIQRELDKLPVEISVEDRFSIVEQKLMEGNFNVGDFVLIAIPKAKRKGKLEAIWKGPYKITAVVDARVYEVEHILSKERRNVHAIRMRFFAENGMDITEEIIDAVKSDGNYDGMFEVEKLVDVRFNHELVQWEILVKWKGFDDVENTWEALHELRSTISATVDKFIEDLPDGANKKKLLEVASIPVADVTDSRSKRRPNARASNKRAAVDVAGSRPSKRRKR
jgi:hypothetical protein